MAMRFWFVSMMLAIFGWLGAQEAAKQGSGETAAPAEKKFERPKYQTCRYEED